MKRRTFLQAIGLAPLAAIGIASAKPAEPEDYLSDLICDFPPDHTPDMASYQSIGSREDLTDMIYQITPEDTPFFTMVKK